MATDSIIRNSSKSVNHFSVAGTIYVLTQRGNVRTLTNTDNGISKTYTAPTTLAHDVRLLVKAGDRVTLRNRLTLWVVALILSIRIPTPTTPTAIPLHTASQRGYRQMAQRYGQATPSRNYSAAFADYLNRKSA